MSAQSLQSHVERCFQIWKEQNPGSSREAGVSVAEAMTQLAADGVTTVAQLEGFDIEGIWE
jgi:hypothetical protein